MRIINWKKCKAKWKHLKNIIFPKLGRKPVLDILIGMDYWELYFLIKDMKWDSGEPIAILTPLGWACFGNNNNSFACTQYGKSYFANKTEEFNPWAEKLLRGFWEIFGDRE